MLSTLKLSLIPNPKLEQFQCVEGSQENSIELYTPHVPVIECDSTALLLCKSIM